MIIDIFSEIGSGQAVENLLPQKIIRDILELHHF